MSSSERRCREGAEAGQWTVDEQPLQPIGSLVDFPPANRERDPGWGGASRGLRLDSILRRDSEGGGGGSALTAGSGSGEEGRPEATVASHP